MKHTEGTLLAYVDRTIREHLHVVETAGECPFHAVMIHDDDTWTVVKPSRLADDDDKDRTVDGIRRVAKQEGAVAVIVMAEAWTADPDEDEFTRPSESPNRKEIVMVQAETIYGSAAYTIPIHRTNGQFMLGERTKHEECGGRMSHFLGSTR